MVFYAASYYPRYGDPLGTFVALSKGRVVGADPAYCAVSIACELAADWERRELPGYCDDGCGDCCFCCPDIVAGQAFTYRAKDLFTAAELKEHRRALMRGEVVCLHR